MKEKSFLRFMVVAAMILILPALLSAGVAPPTVDLSQTGQSVIYSAGDDGDVMAGVAWPSPRFTNPDGSTPVSGNVALDQLTGLYWERNGNAAGLVNYDNATGHCTGLSLDSYSDFRLPNILELESLNNAGAADSAVWLNTQGFQNVQSDNYWVSENYGAYVDYGWIMHLGTTQTLIEQYFGDTHRVVCVRGGANGAAGGFPAEIRKTGATTSYEPNDDGDLEWGVTAWDAGRFTDNTDGTMTDNLTGLMWTKNGNRPSVEMGATTNVVLWTAALAFIDDMNNGTNNSGLCGVDSVCDNFGHTDWRLPNFKELWESMTHWEDETSTDDLQAYGFVDLGVAKRENGNTNNWCGIWTSTTDPANTNQVFSSSLHFGGNMKRSYSKDTTGLEGCGLYEGAHNPKVVWPVRGGVLPSPPQEISLPQTGQTTAHTAGDDGDVRAGVAWPTGGTSPSGRFDDNGDGTVTDLLTGLMWTKSANNGPSTFFVAINAIDALTTGGHDDWRAPNMLELESMTHAGQADSAAWLNSEGFTGVQPVEYWVSNVYVNAGNGGWSLNLGTDQTSFWLGWGSDTRHYWAVRGGAKGAPGGFPAEVRKTGQTESYTPGDDGDDALEWGVAPPLPRFTDNSDGTMTDDFTDLMWTQSASPLSTIGAAGTIHSYSDAQGFVDAINAGDQVCRVDPAQRKQCFPWGGRPVIPQTLCPTDYVCVGATLNPDTYGECYGPGLTYCNVDGDCNAAENEECAQLDNHGYTDWRMANKREMYSLTHWDSDLSNNLNNEFSTDELAAAGFTVPNFAWCSHWTSTADPADPNKVFGVTLATGGHQMLTHPLVTTAGPLSCNWSYVPQFVWPVRGGLVEVLDISVSGSGRNYPIPRRRASLTVNADSADLAGSLVRYYFTHQRLNFVSTSITSVTGGGGTIIITGTGNATKARGADCLGCDFTVTIVDGSPDAMGIVITNGGMYFQEPGGGGTRDLSGGNFTIVE